MTFTELFPFYLRLPVSLTSNFGKQKRDINLIFVILYNQCRSKDAHKLFRRKHAPITTFDNLKTELDNVMLQKIYIDID